MLRTTLTSATNRILAWSMTFLMIVWLAACSGGSSDDATATNPTLNKVAVPNEATKLAALSAVVQATPTLLATGFNNITAIASDGTFIYVGTINGQLFRMTKTGTDLRTIATVSGFIGDIEFNNGKIWFYGNPTTFGGASIYTMPQDLSTGPTVFLSNVVKLMGINGPAVYYWDGDSGIKSIPIGGGKPDVLLPSVFVLQFAVDGSSIFLNGLNGGVVRLDTLTKTLSTVIAQASAPANVFVDANNVYTSNRCINANNVCTGIGIPTIVQAPKQGGATIPLVTLAIEGEAFLSDGTSVYYQEGPGGVALTNTLKSIPVGGGAPTTLAAGVSVRFMIKVGDALYWANPDAAGQAAIYRLDLVSNLNAFLKFPLAVACNGIPCTPFTARIASIMDHSGTPLDPVNNPGRFYVPDGKIKAYTDETGEATFGTNCSPGPGYKNATGADFIVNGNYVGATCPDNKPHDPDANIHPRQFLNYDGHSGYDYPYPKGTPIVAPAAGRLFKAETDSVNHNSACLHANGWKEWHTFYIVHDNGYSTWYLHGELGDAIEKQIGNDYAKSVPVSKGQMVGFVGHFGACFPVPYHLHFEVRKGLDQVVDPYSDGLWIAP
jgi:murein DD-endopeptidase MepM/ murein hydrolase activator NlpD